MQTPNTEQLFDAFYVRILDKHIRKFFTRWIKQMMFNIKEATLRESPCAYIDLYQKYAHIQIREIGSIMQKIHMMCDRISNEFIEKSKQHKTQISAYDTMMIIMRKCIRYISNLINDHTNDYRFSKLCEIHATYIIAPDAKKMEQIITAINAH